MSLLYLFFDIVFNQTWGRHCSKTVKEVIETIYNDQYTCTDHQCIRVTTERRYSKCLQSRMFIFVAVDHS